MCLELDGRLVVYSQHLLYFILPINWLRDLFLCWRPSRSRWPRLEVERRREFVLALLVWTCGSSSAPRSFGALQLFVLVQQTSFPISWRNQKPFRSTCGLPVGGALCLEINVHHLLQTSDTFVGADDSERINKRGPSVGVRHSRPTCLQPRLLSGLVRLFVRSGPSSSSTAVNDVILYKPTGRETLNILLLMNPEQSLNWPEIRPSELNEVPVHTSRGRRPSTQKPLTVETVETRPRHVFYSV